MVSILSFLELFVANSPTLVKVELEFELTTVSFTKERRKKKEEGRERGKKEERKERREIEKEIINFHEDVQPLFSSRGADCHKVLKY